VHDYFDILGIPDTAGASEVRRTCARRVRRSHPDFRSSGPAFGAGAAASGPATTLVLELAVDFVDPLSFVDRMQLAFFANADLQPGER
jgi:hypothetical protein